MNKAITINTGLMLIVSFLFTWSIKSLLANNLGSEAYSWGFILGRGTTGVLFSLILVLLARLITRRKPMFTKGAFISWWVLFIFFSLISFLGSMMQAQL